MGTILLVGLPYSGLVGNGRRTVWPSERELYILRYYSIAAGRPADTQRMPAQTYL